MQRWERAKRKSLGGGGTWKDGDFARGNGPWVNADFTASGDVELNVDDQFFQGVGVQLKRLFRHDETGEVNGYGVVPRVGIEEVSAVVAGGGFESGFVWRTLQTDDGVGDDRTADVGDESGQRGRRFADG